MWQPIVEWYSLTLISLMGHYECMQLSKLSSESLASRALGLVGLDLDPKISLAFSNICNVSMLSNSNIDACDADEEDLASGSGPSSEPFQSKKPRSSVRFEKKSMMAFIEYPSHSELQRDGILKPKLICINASLSKKGITSHESWPVHHKLKPTI